MSNIDTNDIVVPIIFRRDFQEILLAWHNDEKRLVPAGTEHRQEGESLLETLSRSIFGEELEGSNFYLLNISKNKSKINKPFWQTSYYGTEGLVNLHTFLVEAISPDNIKIVTPELSDLRWINEMRSKDNTPFNFDSKEYSWDPIAKKILSLSFNIYNQYQNRERKSFHLKTHKENKIYLSEAI